MAKNTIKLKKYSDVIEEFVAGDAITPGMLVALDSAGKVVPHGEAAGNAIPMFALEDELQGKTIDIDDAYAAGDPVQVWVAGRGDIVNAIAGAQIAAGDFLVSDGTGKLKPAGSGVSVEISGTVTGAGATLTNLNLTLTGTEGETGQFTGTGTGNISAPVSGTGTGSVAVHAHSIVGQALAAASAANVRVAVRII